MATTYGKKRRKRKKRRGGYGWPIPRSAFPTLYYPFPGAYAATGLQAPYGKTAGGPSPLHPNGSGSPGGGSGSSPNSGPVMPYYPPERSGGPVYAPEGPGYEVPIPTKHYEQPTGDNNPPI